MSTLAIFGVFRNCDRSYRQGREIMGVCIAMPITLSGALVRSFMFILRQKNVQRRNTRSKRTGGKFSCCKKLQYGRFCPLTHLRCVIYRDDSRRVWKRCVAAQP